MRTSKRWGVVKLLLASGTIFLLTSSGSGCQATPETDAKAVTPLCANRLPPKVVEQLRACEDTTCPDAARWVRREYGRLCARLRGIRNEERPAR